MTNNIHHIKKSPKTSLGVLRWRTSSHLSQFRSTLSHGLHRGIFVVGHDVDSRKVLFRAGAGLELGEGGEADGGGLGDGDLQFGQGDQLRRTLHGGSPRNDFIEKTTNVITNSRAFGGLKSG